MVTETIRKTFVAAADWDAADDWSTRWCGYDQLIRAWEEYVIELEAAIDEALKKSRGPWVQLGVHMVEQNLEEAQKMVALLRWRQEDGPSYDMQKAARIVRQTRRKRSHRSSV